MAQMTIYVDHVQLNKAIDTIRSHMSNNESTIQSTARVLKTLENSIAINGNNISNSKELVQSSMKTFAKNNNNGINVFNHMIKIYFKSKDVSSNYVQGKTGEL